MRHDDGHGEALNVCRRSPRPSTENEKWEIRMKRQRLPYTRPAASRAPGRPALVRRHGNGELLEVELWVGGDEHEQEHAGEPHHVGFIGRLIADSQGLSVVQMPRIRVYETRSRTLVAYRSPYSARGSAVMRLPARRKPLCGRWSGETCIVPSRVPFTSTAATAASPGMWDTRVARSRAWSQRFSQRERQPSLRFQVRSTRGDTSEPCPPNRTTSCRDRTFAEGGMNIDVLRG